MTNKIDKTQLSARLDATLTSHYLSLEITVVGLALAMAGVALADLIADPLSLGLRLALLWLMWVGGLLAIAVAYAGPMIGAFSLPPSVPAVIDLIPPLAIGVVEFLMFAVLIRQVGLGARFDFIVGAWFWVVVAFGVVAYATILRAQYLLLRAISQDVYESCARETVSRYVDYLGYSNFGPIPLVGIATSVAILWSIHFRNLWFAMSAVLVIDSLLAGGLWFHRTTAKMWREELGLESAERPSLRRLIPKLRIPGPVKATVSPSPEEPIEL